MKVIHYIPSIDQNTGGTATYIQLLAKELGKLIELHIFTHQSKSPLKMENCIVHYVPKYIPLLHIWTDTISTLFDNIQPDIVHINCCWIPDCAAIQRLALSKNYPVVITPHGMLEPWVLAKNYWKKKLPASLFP